MMCCNFSALEAGKIEDRGRNLSLKCSFGALVGELSGEI